MLRVPAMLLEILFQPATTQTNHFPNSDCDASCVRTKASCVISKVIKIFFRVRV